MNLELSIPQAIIKKKSKQEIYLINLDGN